MRTLLAAGAIAVACPAMAQTTLAPFAEQGCSGQTFYTDFRGNLSQKWSFGGGGSLSDGNNAFASYQGTTQNQTAQTSSNGLTMSILPMSAPNGASWQAPLLNTQNSFKQTYGYYEIAVNLPASMLKPGATWAFWLIGYQWPPEIDIAEFSTPNGNEFDSAQHSATTPYNAPTYRYNVQPGAYVYAVDWEPDKITWYINGQQTQQSDTPSDFHQPMYIVLGSAATSNISSPASMQVLYVRAFKDMASALACVPSTSAPTIASFDKAQPQATPTVEPVQTQVSPIIAQASQPALSLPNLTDPSDLAAEIAATQQQIQQTENALASLPAVITQSRSQATTSAQELTAPQQSPPAPTSNKRHEDDDNDADDQ